MFPGWQNKSNMHRLAWANLTFHPKRKKNVGASLFHFIHRISNNFMSPNQNLMLQHSSAPEQKLNMWITRCTFPMKGETCLGNETKPHAGYSSQSIQLPSLIPGSHESGNEATNLLTNNPSNGLPKPAAVKCY